MVLDTQMNLSFGQQMIGELQQSRRLRNPSRFYYYKRILAAADRSAAMVSWEKFRGSWAYTRFNVVHKLAIQEMIERDHQRSPGCWQ